ncbi:ThiF family adenylyltransferase [Candidatus Micrarchaeota archaeon]|nr:ThiF family adenylyltransferase [Candidatus Micrarchaeota archaeon]
MAGIDEDVFDRQKRVNGWNQEAVSGKNCLVAGAGALGNELVKNLAQVGVGKITVVDFDKIVEANLNRCAFFTKEDVGREKAIVLKEKAEKLTGGATRITAGLRRIEELKESEFSGFDFAFGCLDNLGARLHLNAQSYGKKIFIDGGTTGFLGRVQAVCAPGPCFECGLSKSDYNILWKKYSCVGEALDFVDPKMPALPTTTSIVAAVMANEFLKIAHSPSADEAADLILQGKKIDSLGGAKAGSLIGRQWHYNGLTGEAKTMQLDVRRDCPVH